MSKRPVFTATIEDRDYMDVESHNEIVAELCKDRERLENLGYLMSIHQVIVFERPHNNKWYWRRMGHAKSDGYYDTMGEAIDDAYEAMKREEAHS